jgi:N-acetylmuramoyl-L-alanine amidase
MRFLLGLLLLLLTGRMAVGQSALSKLPRTYRFGYTYISLKDWARANGFQAQWIRKDKELAVTSRFTKLGFTVDSRQAQVNGLTAWLSVPVSVKEGVAYIGLLDLQTLIHPLIFPTRNAPGAGVRTICIDPGHGGKDPGFFVGRNQEKRYTLLLAKEVVVQLNQAGVKSMLTRSTDTYIDPYERPSIAKRNRADLFVSLHFNATPGQASLARGIEIYCLPPAGAAPTHAHGRSDEKNVFPGNSHDNQNVLLAYQLQKALLRKLPVEDRGIRRERFAVLRLATMPAVLVEGGFMTDQAEAERIFDPAYRKRMAGAIVEGLLEYKRLVERVEPVASQSGK